jgi:hypothetical protein
MQMNLLPNELFLLFVTEVPKNIDFGYLNWFFDKLLNVPTGGQDSTFVLMFCFIKGWLQFINEACVAPDAQDIYCSWRKKLIWSLFKDNVLLHRAQVFFQSFDFGVFVKFKSLDVEGLNDFGCETFLSFELAFLLFGGSVGFFENILFCLCSFWRRNLLLLEGFGIVGEDLKGIFPD